MKIDKFIIKQYENEKPIIKNNELEIGNKQTEEFIKFINEFINNQQELEYDFAKVLNDNLWELI